MIPSKAMSKIQPVRSNRNCPKRLNQIPGLGGNTCRSDCSLLQRRVDLEWAGLIALRWDHSSDRERADEGGPIAGYLEPGCRSDRYRRCWCRTSIARVMSFRSKRKIVSV